VAKESTIAFIGCGIMGSAMASRLLDAGHSVAVHNRTRAKCSRLITRGAHYAPHPAAASEKADVIFLCVTDTPDVQSVLLGERGVIEGARPGTIVIDHSTISPTASRDFAKKLAERKITFLDAPVSGGDIGARNGTLSIMVGGDEGAFERVEPLLKKLGSAITWCGPSGAGQLTKLVNQILVSVTNLAVCEALIFAKHQGLDLAKTIAAVGGGAAGSWQLSNLGPRMITGDFRPGFTINLQQKDLNLVMQAAGEANTALPAASLVHQLFTAAQASGHGKDGTQALYSVMEKLASLH
jgi:3-hydroxyisobutyrate dehydrogenase